MKMSKNFRYLFIGALWLLSNYTTYTVAQNGSATVKDLPPCSEPCAETAAAAVGCDTDDIPCLCSHKNFSTATLKCSRDCRPDSLALTREILTEMCANASTSTSTSSTSTSSTTQSKTTSTTSTSTSTSSTSQSSSTSATSSATVTPIPSSSLSQGALQSGSSTVVVIQTVVVAQPSTTSSAAGRLDIGSASIALWALIFSLPPLILVVTAI